VDLSGATTRGFTEQQLYSTANYKQRDLRGISLGPTVVGWNFSYQNLTGAHIGIASFANFSHADLTDATVDMADEADFTAAIISGADLVNISAEALYSTASYQHKDLRRITLSGLLVSGLNL
jgi:uncharacterized protein YjbI with pentapeptide repeats